MNENETKTTKNPLIAVMIIQAVFVLTILSVIFYCKYYAKNDYSEIKEYYLENVCTDTEVDEVLKGALDDEV